MLTPKGFTLVELTVVIGIIIFLSALTLTFTPPARTETSLRAEASLLSQLIRETQVRAVATEYDTRLNSYFIRYGINFNPASGGVVRVFTEPISGGNQSYTAGEEVFTHTLKGGVVVDRVCIVRTTPGPPGCWTTGGLRLDITFQRPSSRATIKGFTGAASFDATKAEITLRNSVGAMATIHVLPSGQVYVTL